MNAFCLFAGLLWSYKGSDAYRLTDAADGQRGPGAPQPLPVPDLQQMQADLARLDSILSVNNAERNNTQAVSSILSDLTLKTAAVGSIPIQTRQWVAVPPYCGPAPRPLPPRLPPPIFVQPPPPPPPQPVAVAGCGALSNCISNYICGLLACICQNCASAGCRCPFVCC